MTAAATVKVKQANFYKDMSRKLKQPVSWIKDTLEKHFDPPFDLEKIPEYKKVLENENLLIVTRDRLLKQYADKTDHAPLPCPCGAPAVPDRLWGWVCSEGGRRHHLVNRLSLHRNISFEEALRLMDVALKSEQEREIQGKEALERAKEKNPQEVQG